MTEARNAYSETDYAYDPASLVLETETVSIDPDGAGARAPVSRSFTRKTDALRRNAGYQLKDGSTLEAEITYAYDPASGHLLSASGDDSGTFTYSYASGTTLVEAIDGPAYDAVNTWVGDRNALDKRQNLVGVTNISTYDYNVNDGGQRTGAVLTGSAFGSGVLLAWGYDAKGQVTTANHSSGTVNDRGYEYDGMGNRTRSSRNTTNPATAASADLASYRSGSLFQSPLGGNALNQHLRLQLYGGSSQPQTFDADGNQLTGIFPYGGTGLRTWDGENQLVGVGVSSPSTHYRYDPFGRRVAKCSGSGSSMTGTIYFYDSWNVAGECKILASSYPLDRTYTWGADLSGSLQGAGGVGGLLAVEIEAGADAGVYYPTYDGNGNISEYLDALGTVVAHQEYGPFGEAYNVSGSKAGIFTHYFSTKPYDAETGFYYYGYRYYDPVTGRWPSRDPIGEKGGINVYNFIGNAATDRIDALGLKRSKHTVENCEVYIFYGHAHSGHDWWFEGCGLGGFVGCFPRTNNPPNGNRHVDDAPNHNELMAIGDGDDDAAENNDNKQNLTTGKDDPNNHEDDEKREGSMPRALDNMTDPESIQKDVQKLCKDCACPQVTVTLEIENDDDILDGLDESNRWAGKFTNKGNNTLKVSKTFDCNSATQAYQLDTGEYD